MNSPKKLIINADDYGLSPEINVAVEELIGAGLLGGVSVLANGRCWEQAAQFLREHPAASAGVHLNAVEGRPLSTSSEVRVLTAGDGSFAGLAMLFGRWAWRPREVSRAVEIEWRAQIEQLLQAGLSLVHADSHQHAHAFPPAFRLAMTLCGEYGIPALRWPGERNRNPQRRIGAWSLNASLAISRTVIRSSPLRRNDHFLGFKRAGTNSLSELLADLNTLREGLTELAVHPSIEDGKPYPKLRGDAERRALLDDSFRRRVNALRIELTTWEKVVR
ncbi:MAG TPA: ChbG/HpnK family deacetylase [Blastocatellia bacterium]|nr:ChbG/HpnK family deacetylase [Blastocatellia bacterium]